MAKDLLFGDNVKLLQRALGGLSLRQQVIQNNLANVETPGFRAGQVSFENALKRALSDPADLPLARTDSRHLRPAGEVDLDRSVAAVFSPTAGSSRNDENTVDVEQEMSVLAETQMMFNALVQLTNLKLNGLRSAITEGRR